MSWSLESNWKVRDTEMIPVIKLMIVKAVIGVEETRCGVSRNGDLQSPQGQQT